MLDDLSEMAGRLHLAENVNKIAYFQSLQYGGLLPNIVGLQEAVLQESASGNSYSFKDCGQKPTVTSYVCSIELTQKTPWFQGVGL